MIVQIDNINKSFGGNLILEDISARIDDNDRIGFIGANGVGKSTLLNLIYGDLTPDSGTLAIDNGKTIGFLKQNSGLDENGTIYSEARIVFSQLDKMAEDMRSLEKEIATLDADGDKYAKLTKEYSSLQSQYELGDGYLIDAKIATVLSGMGFGEVDKSTSISVLSGGERTRLAICKLLLQSPDLLILDEPTNHLDFPTLIWLEQYLQDYKGAILVVSHDRYFLNKLVKIVWEIEHKKLESYKGNYTEYLVLKAERIAFIQKEYEKQQEVIAEYKDFIARNLVRASTTKRAQARRKALEKMEVIAAVKPPPRPPKFRFHISRNPVSDVLVLEDISLSVGEKEDRKHLFDGLNLHVKRGDKLAIVGHNGIGKTSLLKAIIGGAPIDSGTVSWGRNTDISYFEQGEGEFDMNKRVIDELWDDFPHEIELTIRSTLGAAGLVGEEVFKKVGALSGGEKARLKFAKLMLKNGNVIIMDEPTNHLDLPTKEVLDDVLAEYEGTLIVVSHDRYLLNKFPSKIIEMTAHGAKIYNGKYDNYLEAKAKEANKANLEEKEEVMQVAKTKSGYRTKEDRKVTAQRRKRIGEIEGETLLLETDLEVLEYDISLPEIASDYQVLEEKCLEIDEKRRRLSLILEEWAGLMD